MKYAYEDLSPDQFEHLIVVLCQRLLGLATQGFAKGPDGGRDARFSGVAERFPSSTNPWSGRVIIQAKHTNGYNRHFSESDFFSPTNNSCVIVKEVPRIRKLRTDGHLDYYMLFANRRLSGDSDAEIREYISNQASIAADSIYLCCVEQLETYLKWHPEVTAIANISPVDSPLLITPDELAEIVESLANHAGLIKGVVDDPPTPRVSYEEKNKINNMSPEYAKAQRTRYLKETKTIHSFLASPQNINVLRLYETTVDEVQLKIVANRDTDQTFDKVMEYLADILFARDPILRKNKRLTRAILFYMYWNCDIGESDDVATDEALSSR